MFHNDHIQPYTKMEKYKKHKSKKYKLAKKEASSKHSKLQKRHRHSKFKHINAVSDYVGPERLTKHVGIFTKGKISDSISRIEKIMPKEVKARAQQDLQEVLKLTCSVRNKYHKSRNVSCGSIPSDGHSLRSSYKSPQYLCNKTGFASNSWKDKLQKSVGISGVKSILASVHEPQKATSVKEPQLLSRNVLLTTIHPVVKEINNLLFPSCSKNNKLKKKLQHMTKQVVPCSTVSSEKASSSSFCEGSQISFNKEINNSQNIVNEDFHLNPIFTGDIDQNDITNIFPAVNKFVNVSENNDHLMTNVNSVDFPNGICHYEEIISSQETSSVDGKDSVTLIPTSPTTSDDSPVWKLPVLPVNFKPELGSTPILYFRHKMF